MYTYIYIYRYIHTPEFTINHSCGSLYKPPERHYAGTGALQMVRPCSTGCPETGRSWSLCNRQVLKDVRAAQLKSEIVTLL